MKNFNKPVSIVMIAYTEEGHIKKVVEEYYNEILLNLNSNSELTIYLDKPSDRTAEIVKELSKTINIKIMEGKENLGYAGAMKAVLNTAKNDIVFYSDSSGKHRASDFWKLLEYEGEYDIVTGLRIPIGYSIIRRIVTFLQRAIVSILFLMPFYDFNTGYKIIHKNIIGNILDDHKHTKESFSTELLVRAYQKGYTIKNIRVHFVNREGENTGTNLKILPKIIIHSLIGLIKLRLELIRK